MAKKNKLSKKIIFITVLTLFTILLSLFTFSYYTNTAKFFEDSRKADGFSGYALEREANDFIVDGCGADTMLDTVTGLCWDKSLNRHGTSNWATALTDCSNLNHAGHSDWRLPERDELMTLIDEIGGDGSTCTTLSGFGFTGCVNDYYWASNVYQPNTASAWNVGLHNGYVYASGTHVNYVACVR